MEHTINDNEKNGQSVSSCQYFQDNLPHGGVQRDHGGVQPAAAAAVQLGPLHRLGGQVGLLSSYHHHDHHHRHARRGILQPLTVTTDTNKNDTKSVGGSVRSGSVLTHYPGDISCSQLQGHPSAAVQSTGSS